MIPTAIEDKLIEILTISCIDEADTDIVVAFDRFLMDWDEYEDYPRIVLFCNDVDFSETQISPNAPHNKSYTVFIMVMCYGKVYDEILIQRDVIVDRIISTIMANKRLDNLADNITSEKVWNSTINRIRYSKSGIAESYLAGALLELDIQTSMI